MSDDDATPRARTPTTASPARMYDYYLGGKDNYEVDREAADRVIDKHPQSPLVAQNNRRFLTRAVRFIAEAGIDQFVDLGAGMPTPPAPHQTARSVRPDARVVYVDEDPIVLAHARALLERDAGVGVIGRDALRPQDVLSDPGLTGVVDLDRPVGLLTVAFFHFCPGDTAGQVLDEYRKRLAPGSWLVLSAVTTEDLSDDEVDALQRPYAAASRGMYPRPRCEIEALFDGFSLVEPGIVDVARWRGDDTATRLKILGGVARLV